MQSDRKRSAADDGESTVERVYEQLKAMAISFQFRPGDRLNELAIAKQIGVSRTPLREALNRLTVDGFVTFSPKQGFFRKPLSVEEVSDLYELREQLERGAIRLAVKRASDEAIEALEVSLVDPATLAARATHELLALDEAFHEGIVRLSGNAEMIRLIENINSRIRYVRHISMEGRRGTSQLEHRALLDALRRRDADECERLVSQHIGMRQDQIVAAVRDAFARIYMGEASVA